MRWTEFVVDSVELLYHKCHKINLNHNASNIDSPEWIKNKKVKINPKNNDDKCLIYAEIVSLSTKNNPEGVSKIKSFINNIIGEK